MKLLYYIRPMKEKSIYILLYNGIVEMASRDLKNLHTILCLMCQRASQPLPLSYVQCTRNMAEKTSFIHLPDQRHQWEIIERVLLFTRRKKVAREGLTAGVQSEALSGNDGASQGSE